MKQSEFMSTLDLAYLEVEKAAQVVGVEKNSAYAAQEMLYKAIEIVNEKGIPGALKFPVRTSGSQVQQAIVKRSVKNVIDKLKSLPGSYEVHGGEPVETPKEFKQLIADSVIQLEVVANIEPEKKEPEPENPEPDNSGNTDEEEKKSLEGNSGPFGDENF